jgi:integrase
MLLTGCRKGELDNMQVDYRRGTVTFLDTKTHTDRVIPLTSQVRSILERGKWQLKPTNVRYQLKIVEEGLGFRLTAHDLRRSFATLSEWCEIPEGVVRQMMGHTGRGSHERNYRHRSVDLLRKFMERYNDWLVGEDGGFVVD